MSQKILVLYKIELYILKIILYNLQNMSDLIFTACCLTSCFGRKTKSQKVSNKYLKLEKDIKEEIHTFKTIPTYVPEITEGICVKVYDGDTITLASYLPYKDSLLYRFSVRLNGIDTPEIKGKTEDEKKMAVITRNVMREKILHKHVRLENVKLEKYGRLLADVYCDNIHLNNWLIHNRYAVKYDGGTKTSPTNWEQYYNVGK
jgi:micrococcal nuclease